MQTGCDSGAPWHAKQHPWIWSLEFLLVWDAYARLKVRLIGKPTSLPVERWVRGRILGHHFARCRCRFRSCREAYRLEEHVERIRLDRADQRAMLISTLAEIFTVIARNNPAADKLGHLETIVAARGGCRSGTI